MIIALRLRQISKPSLRGTIRYDFYGPYNYFLKTNLIWMGDTLIKRDPKQILVEMPWFKYYLDFILTYRDSIFTFTLVFFFGPQVGTYESRSVRASVCNAVFSELAHQFFLFFCMNLRIHKGSKVTEPDFSGRFSFVQKGPKMAQKCSNHGMLGYIVIK